AIGRPVSVDIIRGGELPDYFGGPLSPFLADAGFPYRDLGIHCLSLIAAFLGPIEDVKAEWRSLGGEPSLAFDEWRTLVSCRDGIGQFQLTWNVKPIQNQVIVQGTNGVLRLDLFSLFSSHRRATPGPRAAERLVNALAESTATASGTVKGAAMFASGKVKRLQGVRDHVADFYARLDDGRPMTVDLEGATQLVRWNEAVARAAEADQAERIAALGPADGAVDVLVTGASGSVGSNVVARLLDSGTSVRCLVRRVPNHPLPGVQYVVGNLGDPAAVDAAVAGAKRVVHAGATMQGSEADFESGTVVGTRNVVESCLRHGVTQLVHISSLAVLDYGGADHGRALDEDSPLEPLPHERGLYTRTTAEAEAIVREAVERHSLPAVIVRPGLIFGGGVDLVTGAVARRAGEGRWLVLGDGEAKLSLIYMDDVVDALMLTIDQDLTDGQIIQLVDPVTPTQDELLAALGDGRKVVHLPASVLRTIGRMSDPLFRKLGRSSPLGPHRLRAGLAHLEFNGTNASKLLGWSPKVGVWEGVKRELSPTPE
ncbi:MAG: NAD-dependent epimerase/dehydratase family protein, partial [Actinomycetes bacterium]